jgi:hypothetical protein
VGYGASGAEMLSEGVFRNAVTIPGSGACPMLPYATGLWWNPNESGWGLNIIQHANNIIFAIWYTYDAEGKMTWFHVPQGTWTDSMTYTGDLYAAAGPSFANPTFNASQVKRRAVGTATLRFSSSGSGTWSYSVDGVSGIKTIERLAF